MYTQEEMDRVIRERDQAENVIDEIKAMLGIDKRWSNHYGYEDFLKDAKDVIASPPADKDDDTGICTHCGFPRKYPGEPCELCHNL